MGMAIKRVSFAGAFLGLASLALMASVSSATPELPAQFQSDNAATVLGLDGLQEIDPSTVKKAAQRLWSKYHPDRVNGTSEEATSKRALYTAISQKIQAARDTLSKYLELNPTYNPTKDSTGFRNTTRPASGSARPHSGEPFKWDHVFSGPSSSREIVTESHFGSSLRGTMFEFLYQSPNVEVAVMPLEGRSDSVSFRLDYLLVLKPALFPQIEIRVLSKSSADASPMLLETKMATYVRGHHEHNINGAGNLADSIVFSDGTFLRAHLLTGTPDQPFHLVPVDAEGRHVMLASKTLFFFNETGRNGWATGAMFMLSKRAPLEILPGPKAPGWKKVQLLENSSVIRLGYQPTVVTCEGLFK